MRGNLSSSDNFDAEYAAHRAHNFSRRHDNPWY
jgi:hypothetical protein